jgi:hypothetical protein
MTKEMNCEFKNYTISGNKIILLLEKDIYTKDMLNGAGQSVADQCKMVVNDKNDTYEVILTSAKNSGDLEDKVILFNDALIGCVSLFQD